MQPTIGQEEAIKVCVERYKNKESYVTIAGPAGTGKTTVVKYIIDALNIDPELDVVHAAYTGKSSLVLREKGAKNAVTLHKLLYIPEKIPDSDDVNFVPRKHLEADYKIIVVDEVSMVPQEMLNLLLSHKVYVIFLGDQAQLPPINGTNDILEHPHCVLTEITRQAAGSPIIRLATHIRGGGTLEYSNEPGMKVLPRSKLTPNTLLGADVVLCGKNATRHQLNRYIRKLKFGDASEECLLEGERLICCRNFWKIVDQSGTSPLVNGSLGTVSNITMKDTKLLKPKISAKFIDETGNVFEKKKISIDYKFLTLNQKTVNDDNYQLFRNVKRPMEFDYGYALTTNKFQGSQADRVLVISEPMFDREFYQRWVYTSLTRSISQCVIIM